MILHGASTSVTGTEKNWAIATHLSVFAGFIVPGIGFFGPLILWMIKRGESPFLDQQGKEAVNLGFSAMIPLFVILISELAFAVLIPQLRPDWSPWFLMAVPVLCTVAIIGIGCAWMVFSIQGAVAASKGQTIRHPVIHRFFT